MPIQDLLYRCPSCGHDPTTPTSRGARCERCGESFEQGRAGAVTVRSAAGSEQEKAVATLIEAIDRMGGPTTRAEDATGAFDYEALVVAACGKQHQAVWWKGGVLGFFERITDRRAATLRIHGTDVTVTSPGREPLVWRLDRIHAMQISSRSIQLNIKNAGLHQMEFLSDSPKRWEDLLKIALNRFYGALGREVVEYHPQIVTRALS